MSSIPSPSSATSAIPAILRAKPKSTWLPPAWPIPLISAPKPSSLSSITCASIRRAQYGFYFIDAEEGRWNSGREENNLGYRPRYKEGYFPVPPTDHYQDLRSRNGLTMQSCGIDVECHHHEVATGGQDRNRPEVRLAGPLGRQDAALQIRREERGQPPGQDRDVHAQADLRRQRQRHALSPVPVEVRRTAVCRRRIRRALEPRPVVRRRTHQARTRALGDHRAHHQLLQASRARLRSSRESGLLAAQSLGRLPHSYVLGRPQGKARRVSPARPRAAIPTWPLRRC